MKPVKSSNLSAVGYDSASKTLTVHFKSGGKHQYVGVPDKHHTGLMEADSPGSYFHQHIRGNADYKASAVKED